MSDINFKKRNKILIKNAFEIVTPLGKTAKYGKNMSDLRIIENGSIIIENGLIKEIANGSSNNRKFIEKDFTVIDASKKAVLPGFVDSHTHFLFAGSRVEEFYKRIKGMEYMDILKKGGGILQTVECTRNTHEKNLHDLGLKYLSEIYKMGITTIEGKSGYGLDFNTEIKMLNTMKELQKLSPIDIVITFLGAHAIPLEYKNNKEEYVDFIIKDLLPYISKNNLAEFCDIFCENEGFNVFNSRKILQKAKSYGMKVKLHADEMTYCGCSDLAVELGATSADHLLNISDEATEKLSKSETVATLLPLTAFCLKKDLPPARKLIDKGCAVALASDFNPGSCFSFSIPLIIALSVLYMDMSIEEVITALTINGAAALNRSNEIGSIEEGKKADLILLKYPSYKYLLYHTGMNIVDQVIKNGEVLP